MKKLAIIHGALTVVLLTIIGVSLKLPSDLYYKPWFINLFWVGMFCELIIFPNLYIYKEYAKWFHRIIPCFCLSFCMFFLLFFPLFLSSKAFHMVDLTKEDNGYYYNYEYYFNESCPHKATYKSFNLLFYKKVGEERDCKRIY